MVAIIQNPFYGQAGPSPAGGGLGDAFNSLASTFVNTGQNDMARAQFGAQQAAAAKKAAAEDSLGTMIGSYIKPPAGVPGNPAAQGPNQPTPLDPVAFAKAAIASGADPVKLGETLQLGSGLVGGINAPGVAVGSLPGGKYGETPQGFTDQLAQKTAANIQEAGAKAKTETPYNVSGLGPDGKPVNVISTNPVEDAKNLGLVNPHVGSAGGGSVINNNLPPDQSAFEKGVGAEDAKYYSDIANSAKAAPQTVEMANEINHNLALIKANGGTVGGTNQQAVLNAQKNINAFVQGVGGQSIFDPDTLAAKDVVNKLSMNMLTSQFKNAFGSRPAAVELTMLQKAYPGLENSEGGNAVITDAIKQTAARQMGLKQAIDEARVAASQTGKPFNANDMYSIERQYVAAHPVVYKGVDITSPQGQSLLTQDFGAGASAQPQTLNYTPGVGLH